MDRIINKTVTNWVDPTSDEIYQSESYQFYSDHVPGDLDENPCLVTASCSGRPGDITSYSYSYVNVDEWETATSKTWQY